MSLEVTSTIGGLVSANPSGPTDPKSQGDDHIRLLKTVLKTTFPNLNGVMTATPAQLNALAVAGTIAVVLPTGGVTKMLFVQAAAPTGWTKVVTNDNAALRIVSGGTGGAAGGTANFTTAFASRTPTGSNTAVALSLAELPPHSHTQQGGFNTGTVSSDHSHFFSVNSGGRSAAHSHSIYGPFLTNLSHDTSGEGDYTVNGGGFTHQSGTESADHFHGVSGNTGGISANHTHAVFLSGQTANAGSGAAHNHTWTGAAMDFAVKYVDAIVCSLD